MGGEFKRRHFTGEVILLAVRWDCHVGLNEMLGEWNVAVDHTTP